jgi:hypothetical protein
MIGNANSRHIVQGEVYKNNQFVFVRGETTPRDKAVEEPKDFWVARILQVRAKNAQHVYALVSESVSLISKITTESLFIRLLGCIGQTSYLPQRNQLPIK